MTPKQLAILAVAAIGATAGGMAQARDGVQWSVTLASPFNLPLPPVPVITVSRPAVVVQAPVYGPVYGGPAYGAPVYGGAVYGPVYRGGYNHRWHERDRRAYGGYGDADRDGIPNRYDRAYNPRGDRDGDGVPNRYDRHDRNPYRR